MGRPGGGVLNKGAAPRSTRHFGRQFYDPRVDVVELPEATGFLRARLNYKYPRPWKTQDPEVWRHPDYLLPPLDQPLSVPHDPTFTHLCFSREHVDRKQPEILQANPHLARPRPGTM